MREDRELDVADVPGKQVVGDGYASRVAGGWCIKFSEPARPGEVNVEGNRAAQVVRPKFLDALEQARARASRVSKEEAEEKIDALLRAASVGPF